MDLGDRVLYLRNYPVDLNSDLGTVVDTDEDGDPVILFDDGFQNAINREDVAPVKEKRPTQSTLF